MEVTLQRVKNPTIEPRWERRHSWRRLCSDATSCGNTYRPSRNGSSNSAVLLLILPINDLATALLVVVFPQSAVSFWPYAHMAAVNAMSKDQPGQKVFDLDFAMNVLACSMPFSVVLILAIYSSGDFFAGTAHLFSFAGAFLFVAVIPVVIPFFRVQYYARD